MKKRESISWKERLFRLAIWRGILATVHVAPLSPSPTYPASHRPLRRCVSTIFHHRLLSSSFQASSLQWHDIYSKTRDIQRFSSVSSSRLWSSTGQDHASDNDPPLLLNEDYLVVDSLHLPDHQRPSLLAVLNNPRDILALALITVAAGVSMCNILGLYSSMYSQLERVSVLLGFLSGLAGLLQAVTGYRVNQPSASSPRRRGLADDANVNIYAGIYALTVSWLALRTSTFCPEWLVSLDTILPWVAIGVFFLAVAVPAVTLFNPGRILDDAPPLSETELLRMRGLLAIGILASIFGPDCLAFASGGREWWDRVSDLHPSQQTLESSTSLFALYANEASMVSHRCGRAGVAPFRTIVPSFAAICFLLAILPCIAALYWLGNDVSFFSFYGE